MKTCKGKLREDDTCDYCGGLNPETVLNLIEFDGAEVTPTDKNYKIYVNGKKVYFEDFTDEQKSKFISLYNDKKMKMAYPGHFYVLPYFTSKAVQS